MIIQFFNKRVLYMTKILRYDLLIVQYSFVYFLN
jgi:hypothetical protein